MAEMMTHRWGQFKHKKYICGMILTFLHQWCICIEDFYLLPFGWNNETNDWTINHRPSCPYNDVKHIFPLFILRNEKRQKWKFPFETSSWPLGNNHYDLLLPQHVTLTWPNTKWPLVSPRCSIRDPSPLPSSTYLTIVREVWWWGWQKNVVTVSLSLVLKHKNSTQLLPSHNWDLPKFAVEKV